MALVPVGPICKRIRYGCDRLNDDHRDRDFGRFLDLSANYEKWKSHSKNRFKVRCSAGSSASRQTRSPPLPVASVLPPAETADVTNRRYLIWTSGESIFRSRAVGGNSDYSDRSEIVTHRAACAKITARLGRFGWNPNNSGSRRSEAARAAGTGVPQINSIDPARIDAKAAEM